MLHFGRKSSRADLVIPDMFDAECLSGAALITKAPGLLDQIAA
ncbi:MAG: hypothetical protein WBM24_04315 [Candidatus Sulfotelmatobacter sp.]